MTFITLHVTATQRYVNSCKLTGALMMTLLTNSITTAIRKHNDKR